MAQDHGGPAFPYKERVKLNGDMAGLVQIVDAPGMTLRDYFAGQALPALIRRFGIMDEPANAVASEQAYQVADAMLAERAK